MTPSRTDRLLFNLRLVFLGLFALGAVGVWAYQIYWVQPAKRCEAQQRWWDPKDRVCATPVSITSFTRRPISPQPAQPAPQQQP